MSVVAPAFGGPTRDHRTRMSIPDRDGRDIREPGNSSRRRPTGGRAVPQPPVIVATPTIYGSIRYQGARVIGAWCDGDYADETRHGDRRGSTLSGAVPQLSIPIGAPALGCLVGQHRAAVEPAGRKCGCTGEVANVDGCRPVGGGAVPQGSVRVTAPAFGRAARHQRACVFIPSGKGSNSPRRGRGRIGTRLSGQLRCDHPKSALHGDCSRKRHQTRTQHRSAKRQGLPPLELTRGVRGFRPRLRSG